ncbi:MAG: hypothetical protein IJ115_00865 [Erysipelotrichaceae bacterium]|nr:hypothetical protein [Erysipelotrichaceae bacterium]
MSEIFDLIVDPLGLPLSPLWEWVILLIIGVIAYRTAYGIIGDAYSDGMISSSGAGFILHWIIRLVVFIVIWAITYGVITIAKVIIANKSIVLIGIIAIVVIFLVYLVIRRFDKKNIENEETSDNQK